MDRCPFVSSHLRNCSFVFYYDIFKLVLITYEMLSCCFCQSDARGVNLTTVKLAGQRGTVTGAA